MRIISFAWTTPALVAGAKTVTRRDWAASWAAKFKAGDLVAAYDKSPRFGGRQVGVIRLTDDPVLQSTRDAPDSDWEAEGFAWLQAQGVKVDGIEPRRLWAIWRRVKPADLWVVRFRLVPPMTAG